MQQNRLRRRTTLRRSMRFVEPFLGVARTQRYTHALYGCEMRMMRSHEMDDGWMVETIAGEEWKNGICHRNVIALVSFSWR